MLFDALLTKAVNKNTNESTLVIDDFLLNPKTNSILPVCQTFN